MTVVPGTSDPGVKVSLEPVVQALSEELQYLLDNGWQVEDSSRGGEKFVCKLRLLSICADSR